MDLINKQRNEPITSKEETCFANILGNKTIPKELIPALNINNYINPIIPTGKGDEVGWTGYLQQNSFDYMLGGTTNTPSNAAALKPRFIFGNTPQAYSTKIISKAIITNAGSGYTSIPTVTITGDGAGAVGYAILNSGQISEIRISQGGQNYTNAAITISGGGGTGATALAYITSGQISSNLIYSESKSIFSKLGTDGTYIGTEFYTKIQSAQLTPNFGNFGLRSVVLHNSNANPNGNPQTVSSKTFIISNPKVMKLEANIPISYTVFSSSLTENDNVNLTLTLQLSSDPTFTNNILGESRDFTLKNSRYGANTDFNPTTVASYNLSFATMFAEFIAPSVPTSYYCRAIIQINAMTNPSITQIVKQITSADIIWTLIDPATYGQY